MADRLPGLYAVIPVDILHDQTLRPNAKLLYAEISALADERGYCWACNRYLGERFGLAERTVSDLVAQLAEHGYVRIEVVRDDKNEVEERRIWVNFFYTPLPPKLAIPPAKNGYTPIAKNGEIINTSSNNNIPPKAPPEEKPKKPRKHRAEYKEKADHLPVRFDGFWSYYCSVTPASKTPGNRQAALRAWDKLAPDEQLVNVMGKALKAQSRTEDWKRGIGVPHASTWLNGRRWEDPVSGSGEGLAVPERKEGWD